MAKKETKTNQKDNSKNKKSFFKDFKAELKKVVWPTPKQLINNTIAVITIVLITATIVFVLDLTFEAMNKHGVDKIKEVINTTSENTISEESTTTEQNESEDNVEDQTTVENTEDTENNVE